MGIVVKIVLIALIVVLVVGMVMRMFRRPAGPRPSGPKQQKLPTVVMLIGWLLLIVGLALALAAFSARPDTDPTWMRVGAVAALLLGLLVLLAHRNRFVQPSSDAVRFRTVLGRESSIAYRDIASYRMKDAGRFSRLSIRTADGTRMRVNPALYDLSPLLAAIRFKERTGRWPSPGEAR